MNHTGTMLVLVILAACEKPRAERVLRESAGVTADAAPEPPDAAMRDAGAVAPGVTGATEPPGPMMLLKGGRFKMGTDGVGYGDWAPNVSPSRMVTIPSFRLDIAKVTVAQYRACARAGACSLPDKREKTAWNRSAFWNAPDGRPIDFITWQQARDYCAWAGKRLPTDEELEYACAGPSGRDFPWGWHGQAPKDVTPQGIRDLKDNREWTASIFCRYDNLTCAADAGVDTARAVRGGNYYSEGLDVRCVWREAGDPTQAAYQVGFRCAQHVDETPDAGGATP